MTVLFAGLAIVLVVIGAFFTFSRGGEETPAFQLPSLHNNYKNNLALAQALIEWMRPHDAALADWLQTMNPKAQEEIVKEVEKFCQKKHFHMAWVIDQQIEDEALQMTLTQFLLQFLQGERMLAQSESELKAYVALVDLVQNINRRKRKQKAQLVYLQLVNNEVLPQGNLDMLLSKDKKRWENAAKSITLASRTNRPMVNVAISEHVLEERPAADPVIAIPSRSTVVS